MSTTRIHLALAVTAALAIAAASPVQAGTMHKNHPEAKVSMRAARATALAQVPGGKIRSGELEREHGKLIYSFDIRQPGKRGVEEVKVDAKTGDFLSKHHESAKAERAERKETRY